MAYQFATASSQYVNATLPVAINKPVTFFGWFSPNVGDANTVIAISEASSGPKRKMLYISGLKVVTSEVDNSGNASEAITTVQATQSEWNAALGVFLSDTNRVAYVNGGNAVANNTSRDSGALTRIGVGARLRENIWGSFFDGKLSEAAIWNVALTDDEIASLAKGFKPTRIRPQSLVFYAPLLRNLQDLKGGLALTNNNGATVADHPRVY